MAMKTNRLLSPFVHGLMVMGLAASALAAAPVALAAPAAPQKQTTSAPQPKALAVPAPVPAAITTTVGCTAPYVVQSGDTLWKIGLNKNLDWPQIAAKNNLTNPGLIYAGQTLCLSGVGTVPVTTTTTTSDPVAPVGIPVIEVVSVVADKSVTLKASNFPAGKQVDVRMGKNGTLGAGGALATTVDAGTGVFTGTYTIPAELKGQSVIAIRLESRWGGYYSYGWFYNRTTTP
jgi:LysM repeat protein